MRLKFLPVTALAPCLVAYIAPSSKALPPAADPMRVNERLDDHERRIANLERSSGVQTRAYHDVAPVVSSAPAPVFRGFGASAYSEPAECVQQVVHVREVPVVRAVSVRSEGDCLVSSSFRASSDGDCMTSSSARASASDCESSGSSTRSGRRGLFRRR